MIQPSKRCKRHPVPVRPVRSVERHSVAKVRIVRPGRRIGPEYASAGLVIIALDRIKECRVLRLHPFKIIQDMLNPNSKGPLPATTH